MDLQEQKIRDDLLKLDLETLRDALRLVLHDIITDPKEAEEIERRVLASTRAQLIEFWVNALRLHGKFKASLN